MVGSIADSRPEQLDLSGKLRHVMNKVTQCECPDDIVAVVGTNLASLDAENMLLWDEFIKVSEIKHTVECRSLTLEFVVLFDNCFFSR